MAIALVGSPLTGTMDNGGDVTITLPAMAAGDVVIVFGGHPHRAGAPLGPSTSGYTEMFSPFNTQTPNFGAWVKVMGGSPDASVVLAGTGNANDAAGYGGWVLRGVETSNIQDAVAVTTGPTTSTNPDPPSITTVTDGAWVLAIAGSSVGDTTPGTPTNYENQATAAGIDAVSMGASGVTRAKATAGAEDPAVFDTWANSTWYAASLAIRPGTGTSAGRGMLMMMGLGR